MARNSDSGRRMRVLVVEDEPDTLASLRDLLEGSLPEIEVLTAVSGLEALQLLERGTVDLILTDYRMKGMNGLDFLLAARERAPRVPRLLMTAYPDMDVAIAAINEGHVSGFYQKPMEANEIVDAVRAWLTDRDAAAHVAQELANELDALRRQRTKNPPPARVP